MTCKLERKGGGGSEGEKEKRSRAEGRKAETLVVALFFFLIESEFT